MPYTGVRQRVSQSLLVTALVFAASLGYWGITSLEGPSADGKCPGGGDGAKCAAAPAVSVQTDKSAYGPGETVSFTLRNDSAQVVTLANGAPFGILQGTAPIFTPVATSALVLLEPGQSKQWSWDQKTSSGGLVPTGSYTIRVSYSVNGALTSLDTSVSISAAPTTGSSAFSVSATNGSAPLKVSLSCTGSETGFTVDFGDGVTAQEVTCPVTLTHSYTNPGSYTLVEKKGDTERGRQAITVTGSTSAATDGKGDGKGKPAALGKSGVDLGTTLAVATLISALATFVIVRRGARV